MEGQFIVLDKEKKVVAIVSDSKVVVNDEYQVIFDRKEEYRFIDCGNGIVRVVKEKTPQDVLNQGEMRKKEFEINQKLNQLKNSRNHLIVTLGKERFESITNDIWMIIESENLNLTPGILEDLFNYVTLVAKI